MAPQPRPEGVGAALSAAVARDGSVAQPFVQALIAGGAKTDLADAVHFLCLLHGRYPGVMDHAADRVFDQGAREWMFRAAAGFAAERAFLTRLVVAVGPVPSTLGQAQSENAVVGQSNALAVLSQSERRGTAIGAAFALALDWRTVRLVIEAAARAFGMAPPPLDLPCAADTIAATDLVTASTGIERAIGFGVQQVLIQHRGLWDLLESRVAARTAA